MRSLESMSPATLFISYDGLLDPLGGSQILPYVRSIARHPRPVHVLSFEKPDRFRDGASALRAQLLAEGIGWTAVPFSRGGKLRKAGDLLRMYAVATALTRRHRFGIVHCRSYQAGQVGRFLKRWWRCRFVFDMRGLWADERIDGGLWRRERMVDRLAYGYYKRVEPQLLEAADHVVVLTQRIVPELHRLAPRMTAPVSVIPCCADFDHFHLPDPAVRAATRLRLGIDPDAFVLGYLGSLGTWYMFDEMIRFFTAAARARPALQLLVITRDWGPEYLVRFREAAGAELESRLHVVAASRAEVPALLGTFDVMLSFIKPAYSKWASSPTKLAEAYACGVPVVCNPGVGDVDDQVRSLRAGRMLDPTSPGEVARAIADLGAIRALGGAALRRRAQACFDLAIAADAYRRVYGQLESG